MRTFILALLVGILIGAAGYWYFNTQRSGSDLVTAREKVANGAGRIRDKISEIKTEDIKDELNRTGMIVREKAKKAGQAIADATANARITAAIKSKLIAEPGISALSINVDTTDGLVTLSGTAGSEEEIAKAVRIALETEGVHKVISTLQVKPAR